MMRFAYQAVNASGQTTQGTLTVASQAEALQRIRDMGLFPLKLTERQARRAVRALAAASAGPRHSWMARLGRIEIPLLPGGVKPAVLAAFTRQLATLIDAGMPLLRGLRILQQQESNPRLKRILGDVSEAIEGGSSLTEALAEHSRVFDPLYVNMVRAGEVGGVLDVTLKRLAEFMEKARKIKGKVKAAMFYPVAVLMVAFGILTLMMVFIVPRFKEVFEGLLGNAQMPAFTRFVMQLSDIAREHAPVSALILVGVGGALFGATRTTAGRWVFDRSKLSAPIVGPVFRKSAISRLTRTLGTLLHSGVPILQALTIVRDAASNVTIRRLVSNIHESVKQGDTVTAPLRSSPVFAPVYVGMVDVGEQTGALPDMLLKIADQCDDDVDNAVSAMTSLLEPLLIVILAVIVGGIVIAMFLPLVAIMNSDAIGGPGEDQ